MNDREVAWPPLPLAEWRPTYETVHLWMQVAGKIRLGLTPLINHWWNSTLYLTARGVTTGMMPLEDRALEIRFDFVDHQLLIESSHAATVRLPLQPQTCATFYETLLGALRGIEALDVGSVGVSERPVEREVPAEIEEGRLVQRLHPRSVPHRERQPDGDEQAHRKAEHQAWPLRDLDETGEKGPHAGRSSAIYRRPARCTSRVTALPGTVGPSVPSR